VRQIAVSKMKWVELAYLKEETFVNNTVCLRKNDTWLLKIL